MKNRKAKKKPYAVHVMPDPERRPGTYSRDLKLRPAREPKVKADINVRFLTPEDYLLIKNAAAAMDESMNLFITKAALDRAKFPATLTISATNTETFSSS